jgi:hypothetical protein
MRHRSNPRAWIWAAVALQVAGLVFDGVWHGLLNPGFEARTMEEMAAHLATVHLPIYIGALCVFLATGRALVESRRRPAGGRTLPIAVAGALLSVTGEAWHAYTHLQLSTHGGPIAAGTSLLGLTIVVAAVWMDGRAERRRVARGLDREGRRAA